MINLREQVESDGSFTYGSKSKWALPTILIAPDGVEYKHPLVDGVIDEDVSLGGQVIYDTLSIDPDTGAQVIEHKPVVTLRLSELKRVPKAGEKWVVKIPLTPSTTAPLKTFYLERPGEEGGSIGFIRLYLMSIEQV